ncbi:MAG: hypothetical protein IPK32_12110 [Verrucomicrobiaceae bacterium]|nr:hypothetical protein [Verrucomicrobiaceae bacterium]
MNRLLPFVLLLPACAVIPGAADAERETFFLSEVKPILQQNCLSCHNGALRPPAMNLSSKATAFARSASGRDYIQPDDPDCSLLISAVQRGGSHPKMMPRREMSLTEDQIGTLREWIEDGAYWPEGPKGMLTPQVGAESR